MSKQSNETVVTDTKTAARAAKLRALKAKPEAPVVESPAMADKPIAPDDVQAREPRDISELYQGEAAPLPTLIVVPTPDALLTDAAQETDVGAVVEQSVKRAVQNAMHSGGVETRATLVSLRISVWWAIRKDQNITNEVATTHGVDAGVGQYRKQLLPTGRKALDEVQSAFTSLRTFFYARSLPWSVDGPRVVPNASWLDFSREFKRRNDEAKAKLAEFKAAYAAMIEAARAELNGMFNANDYPTADQLDSMFGARLLVMPFPAVADWRTDMDDDTKRALAADMVNDIADGIENAHRALCERLLAPLTKLSERITRYETMRADAQAKGEEKVVPVHSSWLDSVVDAAKDVQRMNFENDEALNVLADDAMMCVAFTTKNALRDEATTRSTVKAKADKVAEKMRAYMTNGKQ